MPRVSVLMAAYNCEKTVAQSIESVLSQTYTDWEFIICDDCSTDGTYGILEQYKEKYPEKFILLRNSENSKLSFSLNRCLEAAGGEYMARMDGDDISLPERFEKQVAFLDSHPEFAVAGTLHTLFDENGDYAVSQYPEYPDKYSMHTCTPYAHATIMMRKSVYDALGGYTVSKRTVRTQDLELWFRFYHAGYSGYNIQEPLYRVLEDKKRRQAQNGKGKVQRRKNSASRLPFARLSFKMVSESA